MISFNGAPVVGFGELDGSEEDEKLFYGTMIGMPFFGLVAGAIGGAMLGHKHGVGLAAAGVVAGGLVGGVSGVVLAQGVLYVIGTSRKNAT